MPHYFETFDIYLQCPACGFVWLAAQVIPGMWWSRPVEGISRECYCPECDTAPPMKVVPLVY